jgi:hypothetical protein
MRERSGLLDPGTAGARLCSTETSGERERWVSYPCETAFVGVGKRVLSCNRYQEVQDW